MRILGDRRVLRVEDDGDLTYLTLLLYIYEVFTDNYSTTRSQLATRFIYPGESVSP